MALKNGLDIAIAGWGDEDADHHLELRVQPGILEEFEYTVGGSSPLDRDMAVHWMQVADMTCQVAVEEPQTKKDDCQDLHTEAAGLGRYWFLE